MGLVKYRVLTLFLCKLTVGETHIPVLLNRNQQYQDKEKGDEQVDRRNQNNPFAMLTNKKIENKRCHCRQEREKGGKHQENGPRPF